MMAHCSMAPVYEHVHNVQAIKDASNMTHKSVLIKINKVYGESLIIKVSEVDNYAFSYTCEIDKGKFDVMKTEQCLEIAFDEFQSQLIDLLGETIKEQMWLRLETGDTHCKMIFYEKARLKSLIFLTVDLISTDQSEIIHEMARNIAKLKDTNKLLTSQLSSARFELSGQNNSMETALLAKQRYEEQVKRELQTIERTFTLYITNLQKTVSDNLSTLNRRHLKLTTDLEIVRAENRLKCESSARLVNSMQTLRVENERNLKANEELRTEVNHLRILKNNAEESCSASRQGMARKDRENEDLRMQIDELKKDLQDATMIIAQKTKTHDEIAKDLVQANTMIVNFNNQNDALSKELDEAKDILRAKDRAIKEQATHNAKIIEDFNTYKSQHNPEEITKVKQELHFTKQNLHELEKKNKEAVKLNGLLTRKLASGSDANINTRCNNIPPSQRSDY